MVREIAMDGSVTAAELRAGRALLGWTREQLAERSAVDIAEIARLEDGPVTEGEAVAALVQALGEAGVEFGGPGVEGVSRRPAAEALRPEELNAGNDG